MARSLDMPLPNAAVRALVEAGHMIVIGPEGTVLKLDAWADHHPGGRRIIEHSVGREASRELLG